METFYIFRLWELFIFNFSIGKFRKCVYLKLTSFYLENYKGRLDVGWDDMFWCDFCSRKL